MTQQPPPPPPGGTPPPPPPPGGTPPPPPPPGGGGAPPPPPPGGGEPPPPYQYQPPQQVSSAGQPGDLGTRFVAKIIDGILLGLSIGIISAILGLAAFGMGMRSSWGAGVVSTLISTAIVVGYYAFMESSRGQTVGKMVLGLRVQNLEGQNPTVEQALKRNAYFAISLIGILPILGGLIAGLASLAAVIYIAVTINNDTQWRRGWHDQFAGTWVSKTR
ncbi:RDD family protein [Nostocoides sp. F2B08]|uniref:RDD family protein n=1 Tax=Nostocoides sp. F2B08 TaxID=2653936 RepID=UPI0012635839|nr:RDD family protein [Tetrasphaera sp. F2B08]KAB7745416.1 RDD family protein [Tetrasphaera sp. F2B08]